MAPLDRIYLGMTRFSPHTGGNPAEKPVEKLNVDPMALSWEPPVSMGGGVEGKDFGGVGHAWKPGPSYMAASYIASKTTAREATFIPPPHTDYNTVLATSSFQQGGGEKELTIKIKQHTCWEIPSGR